MVIVSNVGVVTITKTGAELNADATNILVKNDSLTEIGIFEVDVD